MLDGKHSAIENYFSVFVRAVRKPKILFIIYLYFLTRQLLGVIVKKNGSIIFATVSPGSYIEGV